MEEEITKLEKLLVTLQAELRDLHEQSNSLEDENEISQNDDHIRIVTKEIQRVEEEIFRKSVTSNGAKSTPGPSGVSDQFGAKTYTLSPKSSPEKQKKRDRYQSKIEESATFLKSIDTVTQKYKDNRDRIFAPAKPVLPPTHTKEHIRTIILTPSPSTLAKVRKLSNETTPQDTNKTTKQNDEPQPREENVQPEPEKVSKSKDEGYKYIILSPKSSHQVPDVEIRKSSLISRPWKQTPKQLSSKIAQQPLKPPSKTSTDKPKLPSKTPTDIQNLPSKTPTDIPNLPSKTPTDIPNLPSKTPTDKPNLPSKTPTDIPNLPSKTPTDIPNLPSKIPTDKPNLPSKTPTDVPNLPSKIPTDKPPSKIPTDKPNLPSKLSLDKPPIKPPSKGSIDKPTQAPSDKSSLKSSPQKIPSKEPLKSAPKTSSKEPLNAAPKTPLKPSLDVPLQAPRKLSWEITSKSYRKSSEEPPNLDLASKKIQTVILTPIASKFQQEKTTHLIKPNSAYQTVVLTPRSSFTRAKPRKSRQDNYIQKQLNKIESKYPPNKLPIKKPPIYKTVVLTPAVSVPEATVAKREVPVILTPVPSLHDALPPRTPRDNKVHPEPEEDTIHPEEERPEDLLQKLDPNKRSELDIAETILAMISEGNPKDKFLNQLKAFGIPDQKKLLRYLLDGDLQTFDFGGLMRKYYSYVLRSYTLVNMQDNYREPYTFSTCFAGLDVSKIGSKAEEQEKEMAKKLQQREEKQEDLRVISADDDHFKYLKQLANEQPTTIPLTVLKGLVEQVMPILIDTYRTYARTLSSYHPCTKTACQQYLRMKYRLQLYNTMEKTRDENPPKSKER